ncbi:thioredoxin-like protein [Ophiobolus disseminans]|uniref:Thioredoxin-like protein n=1 Tax=Ophiobolus disseminans TaxID=1469910 RepID=A0A6A6ZNG0_9PLEO|nr:thioredoxin-like protein [Ophiobolus disseminans]
MSYSSTITFTLDTICPWTYLGFTRLTAALAAFAVSHPDASVTFTLKLAPYQLYPGFSAAGENKYEWYKREKYNGSEERMRMYVGAMRDLGEKDGIAFDFENGMIANTLNAHRILRFLQETYSPSHALVALSSLYEQYFSEAKHPSSRDTLVTACLAAGLSRADAEELVNNEEKWLKETKAAIREQAQNGVDSVPYVVVEGRRRDFTLVGAKSEEDYRKVLEQVVKEAR